MDKLSYFEIKGHLDDHFRTNSILRLYYVKQGMNEWDGLVMLVDDASCQVMLDEHIDGSIVDIWAEKVGMEMTTDDQDIWACEDEADDDGEVPVDETTAEEVGTQEEAAKQALVNSDNSKMHDKDYRSFVAFYRSPSKPSQDIGDNDGEEDDNADDEGNTAWANNDGEDEKAAAVHSYDVDDSLDEDYVQPSDEDSSAKEKEAAEMRKFAYEVKRKNKAKKLGVHGTQVGEIKLEDVVEAMPNLEEPGSPYQDSSDEYSYDENSDGESVRWKSMENRYDIKALILVFFVLVWPSDPAGTSKKH